MYYHYIYVCMYMYVYVYYDIYTVYIMETRCKFPFLALDLEARIKGSWNWVQDLNNWDIIYIYTVTTFKYFKYTNLYFILPPGPRSLARPPHIRMSLPYIYHEKLASGIF